MWAREALADGTLDRVKENKLPGLSGSVGLTQLNSLDLRIRQLAEAQFLHSAQSSYGHFSDQDRTSWEGAKVACNNSFVEAWEQVAGSVNKTVGKGISVARSRQITALNPFSWRKRWLSMGEHVPESARHKTAFSVIANVARSTVMFHGANRAVHMRHQTTKGMVLHTFSGEEVDKKGVTGAAPELTAYCMAWDQDKGKGAEKGKLAPRQDWLLDAYVRNADISICPIGQLAAYRRAGGGSYMRCLRV